MNNLEKYYQEVDELEEKRLQECEEAEIKVKNDFSLILYGFSIGALLNLLFLGLYFEYLPKKLIICDMELMSFGVLIMCLLYFFYPQENISKKYAELRARLERKYINDNEKKESR